MLEIKNLNVNVHGKVILKNIHITARSGEITGIVGKSGSGKSTLFKSILAIDEMVANFQITGQILWEGKDLLNNPNRPIQPVFQDSFTFFSPFLKMSTCLLEPVYIQHGFLVSKKILAEETARIEGFLERFHLKKNVLNKKTSELSGGELQRLAILRAILTNPRMILLDEPVTALDALVQAEIIELIRELNQSQNIGFILVSHDLGLVRNLSDFVYVLDGGEMIEAGRTEEVFLKPKTDFTKQLLLSRDLTVI